MSKIVVMRNREFHTQRINWVHGVITIRAMVDKYPDGNIVTYTASVRKGGELIERNTFSMSSDDTRRMLGRVEYFQSIKAGEDK